MVASCWLFLNNLYYDAQIHEPQKILRETYEYCTTAVIRNAGPHC